MSYTEKQKAKMKMYSGNKAYYYEYDCNGEIWNLKLTPPMKGGHTHNHKQNHYNHCATSKMCRRLCREENLTNWDYNTWERKRRIYVRKATKRQK